MLRQAYQLHDETRRRSSALQERLQREEADVDKLEGLSLTRLFATVLGSREQALEKERAGVPGCQAQI